MSRLRCACFDLLTNSSLVLTSVISTPQKSSIDIKNDYDDDDDNEVHCPQHILGKGVNQDTRVEARSGYLCVLNENVSLIVNLGNKSVRTKMRLI